MFRIYLTAAFILFILTGCAITVVSMPPPLRVCKKDEIATDCRKMAIGEMGGTTRGVKMEIEND